MTDLDDDPPIFDAGATPFSTDTHFDADDDGWTSPALLALRRRPVSAGPSRETIERDRVLAARRAALASTGRKMPRRPIDAEFDAKRIDRRLELTAELFERDYRRATSGAAGAYKPKSSDPARLFGAEVPADASLACRFLAGRLGHLYPVLVKAVVDDREMRHLVDDVFAGESPAAVNARGRCRLIDALRLADAAYAEWHALVDERAPRSTFALGSITTSVPPGMVEAANDNNKRAGNRIHDATRRRG